MGLAVVLPRLRQNKGLLLLCALALGVMTAFTLAGGRTYDRYNLLLMPLVATITAVSLCRLVSRGALVTALALGLVFANGPALARVFDTKREEPRFISDVAEIFRAGIEPDEEPFFVISRGDDFPKSAFVCLVDLDRPVVVLPPRPRERSSERKWNSSRRLPYRGVAHESDLDYVNELVGPVENVETVGEFVIWKRGGE
jgi:hypothetical protein